MAESHNIYGEVNNKKDLEHVVLDIRHDVDNAKSRPDLTELYRRAGYLITLTYAPSWDEKFGKNAKELRDVGQEEFAKTARKINRRAEEIGTDADYDETWGDK
jgi:hypothetical protein